MTEDKTIAAPAPPPTTGSPKPEAEVSTSNPAVPLSTTSTPAPPPTENAVAAEPIAPPPTVESPTSDTPPLPSDTQRETVVNPAVVALRSMFPDFDDLLLQSVLDSVGGNQDRAIDALLGMSDPEYKSETRVEEPVVTQTELDEQLARRLLLEDQHQQQLAWQAQGNQPHQPHEWQGRPVPGRRPSQAQDKDTMAEIGEQLGKFAETGKKTIGNLFSKAKAKFQELEQGRQGQGSSQPGWGPGVPYPYTPPGSSPQPVYYDPNTPTLPNSTPAHGYDATPVPQPTPSTTTATTTNAANITPAAATTTGQTPVDGGKIGLLPKRPVSLLATPSDTPTRPPPKTAPSQDDELEYVENPFEDGRK